MVKKYWWILFIVLLFALTSCAEKEEADAAEKNPQEEEVATEVLDAEDEDEIKALTVDEVKQIVIENMKEREKIMQQLREEHDEWWTQDWSLDSEDEGEEFQAAVAVVKDSLSGIMTDNVLDELAEVYSRAYFCQCDWPIGGEENVRSRVEIIDQSETHFQAKSITLEEGGMFEQGGWTNVWNFKKEKDTWRMDQEQSISPEEESLDLTFEDLEEAFINYETGEPEKIELIEEELQYEGKTYLVILHESGTYSVWDVADGSGNYELREQYNDSNEIGGDLGDDEEEEKVVDDDSKKHISDYTQEDYEAMAPWGGNWDRIDNHGEGQGLLTVQTPFMEFAIIDNKSLVGGIMELTSENRAKFYDEESGCELELTLKDEKTMEVNEVAECNTLISTPEGIYENVGRRK